MPTITSTWTGLVQQFFSVFTAPGAEIFFRLTVGWVLCTARRTITGILPFADPDGRHAHDAYHRFFPDGCWLMERLWQGLAVLLVKTLCPKDVLTVALDDTLFHHSGRKMEGAGRWRDAVRSTAHHVVYAWGLNLVVLTLQVQPPWGGQPLGLPINMRLHRKDSDTLIALAKQMIQEVKEWFPERPLRVVADGFYACLAGRTPDNTVLISRIKRNAKLFDLAPKRNEKRRGRPRTKGKRLPCPENMAASVRDWKRVECRQRGQRIERLVYTRQVLWYAVCRKPILLVISRDPEGREKDDFFFSTDVTMDAKTVLEWYGDRWDIEDTFKNTKQLLGGQEPQTWKRQGPERAAAMSLWLYAMVWLWYLKRPSAKRWFCVRPWQRHKTTPSFADALACLRYELWQDRIISMFGKSAVHDKKFEFLLEALASVA